MQRFRRSAKLLFLLAFAGSLSACAVGPDFERPPPPDVKNYESTPLPEKTASAPVQVGGAAQTFAAGKDIPAEWWKLFRNEPLNQLIVAALKNNPDLAAAEAALREAHENTAAGEGPLFPQVDAGFNAEREKISGSAFGGTSQVPPFTLYNASVSVSYAPDIFGGTRREIESLSAAEDYQRWELEAARLSLTANVVTTAMAEASLRGQVDATNKIIAEEQKSLDLLQNQFKLGGIAKPAVLQQSTTLAQERASLPPLEKQLAQTRHLLSLLAGQLPSEEPGGIFELSKMTLPVEIPVSVPSKLVEQRPDVRAAEATMHAASAEIGVATANMLPQFLLTGDIGSDAAKLASLFAPGTGIWSLAAGIVQPIFHGGTLLHKKRASEAAYDEAAAMYRKTVLAAFQNVADSLHAVKSDAETLKANAEAEHAAGESLNLVEQQYKDGAISFLTLLTAEQAEQQTRIALVQSQALRYADTAALFAALGGGWWNRVDNNDYADARSSANDESSDAPAATTNFNRENSNNGDQ